LAAEMETAALYTITAGFGTQGLSVLTASDSLVTGAAATTQQRQQGYTAMMEIALETAVS
jgi:purine-nucleoside phosphorylase